MNLKEDYYELIEIYQRSFVIAAIAKHCNVSEHLVRKWIGGGTIKAWHKDKLESFDINKFKENEKAPSD